MALRTAGSFAGKKALWNWKRRTAGGEFGTVLASTKVFWNEARTGMGMLTVDVVYAQSDTTASYRR